MSTLKFTETVFSSNGKKGILTPDADGYYTLVLGGLNTYNSAGEYYTADRAKELFLNSSSFMRRVSNGALYSELGHPKKLPGMSMDDFYRRIVSIEETNICAHISEVTLDFEYGRKNPGLNNPDLIAIIGKVKPAGPKADSVRLALENPKQNAAFSIRALSENTMRNGRTEREIFSIVTFDHVTEPGISIADKVSAPGLESRSCVNSEIIDSTIDKQLMRKVITNTMKTVSMESSNRDMFNDILRNTESSYTFKRNSVMDW